MSCENETDLRNLSQKEIEGHIGFHLRRHTEQRGIGNSDPNNKARLDSLSLSLIVRFGPDVYEDLCVRLREEGAGDLLT